MDTRRSRTSARVPPHLPSTLLHLYIAPLCAATAPLSYFAFCLCHRGHPFIIFKTSKPPYTVRRTFARTVRSPLQTHPVRSLPCDPCYTYSIPYLRSLARNPCTVSCVVLIMGLDCVGLYTARWVVLPFASDLQTGVSSTKSVKMPAGRVHVVICAHLL